MAFAGRSDACLAGGGELGALMRSMDWSRTALGPTASWPQSLRTSVSIILGSGFAAAVAWGADHVFLYNDGYRPILGAARHPRALGSRGADVFAESWERVGPLFRRAFAGETVALDDVPLALDRHGRREERPCKLSFSPIRDESGDVGGLMAVVAERTGPPPPRGGGTLYSMAVDEIREQERRFRLLVESVKDYAIFILDPQGHVATWNAGAERIKGYSGEEIIGRHFSAFYPNEEVRAGKCERELATAVEEGRFEEEGWRIRKDGSRFWASVVITPLRNPDGGLLGFAKVTRDLTQRRTAEDNERTLVREQLARAASESASRAKDEFLATMSHELRTPLNAMLGWATILSRGPRDEAKLRRGLEVIERNARAQERLVSDLLDVSRVISGKLHLMLRRTEISAVVHAAADVVRPGAEAKGVRIVVDIDPDVGATVADPDRLQQIMWNLLSNAIRYTPRGGSIAVTGERRDSDIALQVKDTGSGIAREHLPYIFERFRQVDSSTTRSHGGLGLGLSIVRHLVEAHGGSVEAHSEGVGQGARFTVVLPIRALLPPVERTETAPAPGVASAPESNERRRLQDVSVLVVDDDVDSLELVAVALGDGGAKVTAVRSAREALEAEGPFDVIVSDIGMPGMDGYSFMRLIRERDTAAYVPAIALTAYARVEDAERATEAGFQEHFAKPLDVSVLLEAVRKWGRTRHETRDR